MDEFINNEVLISFIINTVQKPIKSITMAESFYGCFNCRWYLWPFSPWRKLIFLQLNHLIGQHKTSRFVDIRVPIEFPSEFKRKTKKKAKTTLFGLGIRDQATQGRKDLYSLFFFIPRDAYTSCYREPAAEPSI